ncbi:MAG: transglutaminase-like domain-containing protein [Bacteroidota bacterium]|nr:transglutaminase-like domain-containing protein [Bacteroidota bacterium]
MENKEIKALIDLLDDPDEEVYSHVKVKLLSFGEQIIPVLEHVWEMGDPFNNIIQTRIETIIHKIQFDNISGELTKWAKEGTNDLLTGAILIAKYQYPDLNEEKIKSKLDQITRDVWLELNDNLTALEKVRILNHIIFDVHGFSGNTVNYHAPQNSYINNVLESKKGNPLSLSILYAIIGQKLGIPVYGVNLPQHFILAYVDKNNTDETFTSQDEVLFYVNPFSRGAVFSKKEIDAFLKQLNVEPNTSFYEPCSNLNIIIRLLNNLIHSYDKLGYPSKKEELKDLLVSLNNVD